MLFWQVVSRWSPCETDLRGGGGICYRKKGWHSGFPGAQGGTLQSANENVESLFWGWLGAPVLVSPVLEAAEAVVQLLRTLLSAWLLSLWAAEGRLRSQMQMCLFIPSGMVLHVWLLAFRPRTRSEQATLQFCTVPHRREQTS